MRGLAFALAFLVCAPAQAETMCGHDIPNKLLVFERASKHHAADKKGKRALGTLIAECEADGVRYLVSAPGGDPASPHISGYIYRKPPP
jgi:hypothetical protein